MTDSDLHRMVNQIARNFAPYGEIAAAEKTAAHIRDFWEPRMVKALLASTGDKPEALDEAARGALDLLEK